MDLQEPGPRVLIRKYRFGDEKAILRLVNEGTMVTVNPFFLRAATREMIVRYFCFIILFFRVLKEVQ